MTIHDPPKEKCDMAEFGDRTTPHPLTEIPKSKSKDNNMNMHTTPTTKKATLTQKELFQRFLDAPYYKGGTISTLGAAPRVSDETMSAHIFGFSGCASLGLPDDLPDQIVDELCECDDPEYEIESIIGDLEGVLRDVRILGREFTSLAAVTRTNAPDEETLDSDTFEKEFREWDDNPKYVLPEVEDKHKTLREAHAVMSKLSREGVVA